MNQEKNTKKTYGHTCPWWLLFTFDNPIRKLIHNPEKILSAHIKNGDTVLDVGCGMGYFSLTMAKFVGEKGKMIAADLQEKMLSGLRKRAVRARLIERIHIQQSSPEKIGVNKSIDFALAFWMAHEVRQQEFFLQEIYELLKPDGMFLLVEPIIHVSGKAFEKTVSLAKSIGLQAISQPRIFASRAVLFRKQA